MSVIKFEVRKQRRQEEKQEKIANFVFVFLNSENFHYISR